MSQKLDRIARLSVLAWLSQQWSCEAAKLVFVCSLLAEKLRITKLDTKLVKSRSQTSSTYLSEDPELDVIANNLRFSCEKS